MGLRCPLCGASGFRYRTRLYRKRAPNSTWSIHGGGQALCDKCVKNRQEEIKAHNRLYNKDRGAKKDPRCKHEWAHPYPGRWTCVKCQAEFNWLCGCGGSAYVCQPHYEEFIGKAKVECGEVLAYIEKHSW